MLTIYLSVFAGIFLLSLSGLGAVLQFISPVHFPILAPALFYVLLFLSGFSFFSLLGYFSRRVFQPKFNKFIIFHISIRQAILLSIFLCATAYLLHIQVFTWWSEMGIAFFLFLIEAYFVIRETKNS